MCFPVSPRRPLPRPPTRCAFLVMCRCDPLPIPLMIPSQKKVGGARSAPSLPRISLAGEDQPIEWRSLLRRGRLALFLAALVALFATVRDFGIAKQFVVHRVFLLCAPRLRVPRFFTTPLAARIAAPSEAPRSSIELLTCFHCLCAFLLFAFFVWRLASELFHGIK